MPSSSFLIFTSLKYILLLLYYLYYKLVVGTLVCVLCPILLLIEVFII